MLVTLEEFTKVFRPEERAELATNAIGEVPTPDRPDGGSS
jgi:hypothetical protein